MPLEKKQKNEHSFWFMKPGTKVRYPDKPAWGEGIIRLIHDREYIIEFVKGGKKRLTNEIFLEIIEEEEHVET